MQFLSFQTELKEGIYIFAQHLFATMQKEPSLTTDAEDKFEIFDTEIARAEEILTLFNKIGEGEGQMTSYLNTIAKTHLESYTELIPVLSAIAVQSQSAQVLSILIPILARIAAVENGLCPQILTIIVHRMSQKGQSPKIQLALLQSLPVLGKDKSSVSVVLQLIKSLATRPGLAAIRLRLLTDLWLNEDRIYPHLRKALDDKTAEKTDHAKDFALAQASAALAVTEKEATKYGADLLPLLSKILNENPGQGETTTCSLALRGIRNLVKAGVIDIRTTVKVLWPKIWADPRPEVFVAFVQILALIPTFPLESEVYVDFKKEVLGQLWGKLGEENLAATAMYK